MVNNDYVSRNECAANNKRLDERIDSVDARVTSVEAIMDRRFAETRAWISDLSTDQKRFFWLMLTSALASIGALIGIVAQLITKVA